MRFAGLRHALSPFVALSTLIYPIALHLFLIADRPRDGLWLIAALAGIHLLSGVVRQRPGAVVFAALMLALAIGSLVAGGTAALYLPPILLSAALLVLFGRTLQRGREPLVTRMARVLMNEDEPAVRQYTRVVTQVWTVFFALMLAESVLLALFAPLAIWSLFTNFINYLLIFLLFCAELCIRKLRFRGHSVRRFARAMIRADLARIARDEDSA